MIMMGSVGFIALLGVRKVDSVKTLGLNMSVIVTADSRTSCTTLAFHHFNHPLCFCVYCMQCHACKCIAFYNKNELMIL